MSEVEPSPGMPHLIKPSRVRAWNRRYRAGPKKIYRAEELAPVNSRVLLRFRVARSHQTAQVRDTSGAAHRCRPCASMVVMVSTFRRDSEHASLRG